MANAAMRNVRQRKAKELEEKFNSRDNGAEQPQDNEPANEAPNTIPEDDKFERLQGKAKKLESDNALIRRELDEAKRQLDTLKNPPPPKKTQAELDEEFENSLRDEVGADTWDYMDDASKRAVITLAKRSNKTSSDVDGKISEAFQKRDEQDKSKAFVKQLDDMLSPRGVSFIQLANNDSFEQWVGSSRRRLAIFEDAMKHRDGEALKDVEYLVSEFYQGSAPNNSTTPAVQQAHKAPRPKTQEVTYDQYLQALRDKRHPSRREAARKIIAAFKEQQEK